VCGREMMIASAPVSNQSVQREKFKKICAVSLPQKILSKNKNSPTLKSFKEHS